MGLSSTLYVGISGLQTNSQAMSVVGNNISNSNTTAFKSSSTVFSDVMATTIASASGNSEVGRGAQISTVKTSFAQGTLEATDSATDLAIQGDGFFIVSAAEEDSVYYTRNGAFSFDDDGYLVSSEGLRVQGSGLDEDGNVMGDIGDIQINLVAQIPAAATAEVDMTTNLDSDSDVVGPFDIADSTDTSNFSTSLIIYDSLGTEHIATCFFTKTANNEWEYNIAVESDELAAAQAGAEDLTVVLTDTLQFDQDGNLIAVGNVDTAALQWNNGSDQGQVVTYNFDITQFDSESTIYYQSQNGNAAGELSTVDIASDGTVSAVYSNGVTEDIAKIALATFTNPAGLSSVGGSLWQETDASGEPAVGFPSEAQGYLITQSLELSNVDLSAEFVDMITIQNGYNAASKVITTVDEMLQEVLNLKR